MLGVNSRGNHLQCSQPLSPTVFFLIKQSVLEDIGTLASAKRESASQYRHFFLSSVRHQASHKSARGVDLMRD